MREDIANLLSDEAVRAWIYRVALLVTIAVVAVVLATGVDADTIVTTVVSVIALVTSALATVNTSRDPGD